MGPEKGRPLSLGWPMTLLTALVTGLTCWVVLLSWDYFSTVPGEYLGPLLLLLPALALVGGVLRALRWPWLAALGVQVLVALIVVVAMFNGDSGLGPLPTPEAVANAWAAIEASVEVSGQYAAPVPATAASLAPLLVALGAVVLLGYDTVANGLGRVPLAGLLLLIVYTVPVSMWGRDVSWLVFVLTSVGFLGLIFLREEVRFNHWGRSVATGRGAGDPDGFGTRNNSARGLALGVGAGSIALAVVGSIVVPTSSVTVFDYGPGRGDGDGLTINDPMADLRRDLDRPVDTDLVTVTTDEPDPQYLKFATLTQWDGTKWTAGDRDLPDEQRADGSALPPPVGVSPSLPRRPFRAEYETAQSFESQWLPVPSPATEVSAPTVWKYDLSTMDFFTGAENQVAGGMTYSARGLDLQYDAQRLVDAVAPPARIESTYTSLNDAYPAIARTEAERLTRDQPSDWAKAVTLQDWFFSGGGFRYSLEPSGDGDLESFLTPGDDGRVGYCEQFASAMAVMARIVGIPARVALGFLRPEQIGDNTYVYSSDDLHAWPELYFEGSGWVRMEPTPATRTDTTPAYTQGDFTASPETSPEPTVDASAGDDVPDRGDSASVQPSAAESDDAGAAGAGDRGPWRGVLVIAGGLLVIAAGAVAPRLLREGRTRRRLRLGSADAAWLEVADSARDLGLPWPPGCSPRTNAALIGAHLAAPGDDDERPRLGRETDPEGADALDRLLVAVERSRYSSREETIEAEAHRDEVATVVASLRRGVTTRRRWRAIWAPASLRRVSGRSAGTPPVVDEVREHEPAR